MKKDTIVFINPSVDVYRIGDDLLEFYFITTRERVTMSATLAVISLINNLDGEITVGELCDGIGVSSCDDDVQSFLKYLIGKKILLIADEEERRKTSLAASDLLRYDRQLNFFNSLFPESSYDFQKKLQDVRVLVMGAGAIGAGIALQLTMAGVHHFILVDKDLITIDSLERHFTYKVEDVGRPKVEALARCLKEVDSRVECSVYKQIVDFDTSLDEWLANSDIVINTLDEPYIGYTSLKIGRACYKRNLPLYVAGGFDAHLMSTGELIIPDKTPCVDCYTSYFTETLKDWKPKYNVEALSEIEMNAELFGVGGLASMSLFSISFAVIVILNYLATGNVSYSRGRGELLFDRMNIVYLNVPKNPYCHVCGGK